MRLLLVTWNYSPKVGGMEMLLSQLVRNLRPYADVHVIGPAGQASLDSEQEVNVSRSSRDGLIWFALYAFFEGVRLLSNNAYDVIMAGSALVTPIVYILGRLFRVPSVIYIHGLDLVYSPFLYQWMIKCFLPRCAWVFANSRASEQEALHRGVSPHCTTVLHPGLDFSEFRIVPDIDSIKQRYNLNGRLTLLSAGRLAKRKGLVEFVRYSLPAIVEKHPNVVFIIVGGNPSLSLTHKEDIKSKIQAEAGRLDLENHVHLMGWIGRQDLVNLYHACDVFVLPAIQVPGDMEGFGIVLIEAGAAGKPVISTRLGGVTDAVVDGKSGILVEAERWDQLSDAILTLLADESLRREMGQFGRERAKAELDWPIVARRYLIHLEALLQEKR
jgi:phosphatidylinositol alpha-1,6-mannosyltransferase